MLFRQSFKPEFSTCSNPQTSAREALSFDPVLAKLNHNLTVIEDPGSKLVDAISMPRECTEA